MRRLSGAARMGLLAGMRALALDTETTGMSPASGATLVEVAWVRIENGEPVAESAPGARWASLVNPGQPIPPDATRVHRITDEMVAGAPGPCAVAPVLRTACADLPLVMHNAPFDLPFLQDLMRRTGQKPLDNVVVDTLGLARGLFEGGGNSLGALAARFALRLETAHRALGDALTTAELLGRLAERWERDFEVRSLAELAAASQDVMRRTARR